jgi:rhamnulokinase
MVEPVKRSYLAIDLGAESGRVMLGTLTASKLSLDEVHRFPNTPLHVADSLCWDIPALLDGIKAGLRKAAELKLPLASLSTDSWGIDYVLLDELGAIIEPTFHYRDARTARGVERVRALVPWPEVFAETGIQFLPMNTIHQLAAEPPERLSRARQLLLVGDAINYFLCGRAAAEESLASTTQLYNPRTRDWSPRLLSALQLPRELFPTLVASGTKLGALKPELARETGLDSIEVIASCSHDTGAAVAAIPAQGEDWAYISSGTWSLLGAELSSPLLTAQCREFNFTNEIGFGGSVRLLKNIVGLWIVQECRREWAREGIDLDYAALMRLAADAPPFVSLIDANDPRFLAPGDMPSKIDAFCREAKQPMPDTPGATIRCVLESLALLYGRTVRQLEQLLGRSIQRLHIVGGGSKNELLNRFTANALGIPVLSGPVEATALGNVLVQAIALGDLPSLKTARERVAQSFAVTAYEPHDLPAWRAAGQRVFGA